MKILISPDKFKGSLSAQQVCDAITKGINQFDPAIETVSYPLADGGEGTLDILATTLHLETVKIEVKDPLFRQVCAEYKLDGTVAYIEMAAASGLPLLKSSERNCLKTTTYGTGELILDAIHKGAKKIYLFVGGSATNDAGIGMANALGYQFLDKQGKAINPVGEELINIASIISDNLEFNPDELEINVVCDVKSVLFGPQGAAYVYGPQKGAGDLAVKQLDHGLRHFSNVVRTTFNYDISDIEGGGAAGGIGAGAMVFLNAQIKPGIETIMEITAFEKQLTQVDLIITGEGKLDQQTVHGKVINGVDEVSRKSKIPYGIICGIAEDLEKIEEQLNAIKILQVKKENISTNSAINEAFGHVKNRACEMMELLYLRKSYSGDSE